MYLTSEQRYNIAMRMLGIVEHMVFGREKAIQGAVHVPPVSDTSHDDDLLNDMIREQLKVSDSALMNDGVLDE